jgi:predicted glycogen debranching enzyme
MINLSIALELINWNRIYSLIPAWIETREEHIMIKISVEEIGGQQLSNLEWLVTNGIGGFASGTVSGVLTRRYHGYLVAALKPPVKRINMVAKVDDWVLNHGELYSLSDNVWKSNSELIQPRGGLKSLNHFSLDGTIPTWIYACGNSEIKKQIWMEHGKNTTYIHYTYLSGREGIRLTLKGLLAYCDFHHTNQVSKPYTILPVEQGVKVRAFNNASDYFLFSHSSKATPREIWIKNYYLSEEDYRGQDSLAAYFNGVDFMGELLPGQSLTLVITVDPKAETDGTSALNKQIARDTKFEGAKFVSDSPEWVRQLVLAADQFIVERSIDNQPGNSIIAGYHWFSDWGRDTMIALPGLTLSTGRFNVAEKILRTFALYVDQGMLPNRFPDLGENPVYNTIDATLWYIEAIYQFYKTVTPQDPKKALSLVSDLFPILENIVKFHETGTRYNVKVDPEDGLLYGGEPGVQLTWMDAKVEDFVVTPREGKPVEINALWYSALSIMSEFAGILGREKNEYQDQWK